MKAASCDLVEIGGRMKAAREALGLTQKVFCEQYGYKLRTLQKNEAGSNEAGICLAGAFIRAGINANWLLTGQGSMLLRDATPAERPTLLYPMPANRAILVQEGRPVTFDPALLSAVVQALEAALEAKGAALSPDRKAEVVTLLYQEAAEADPPEVRKDRLLRLLRLVI